MRFLHISDLHIGKSIGNFDLLEDIHHVLFDEILGSISSLYKPDGILISGDIYDHQNISGDCIRLFEEFLEKAAELEIAVFAISGNHDNAPFVSYANSFLRQKNIYISEAFSAQMPITVQPFGEIDIAMMPFFTAAAAARAFPEEEITDINSALKAAFSHAGIPRGNRPCLLLAHQTVLESGSFEVGNTENVDKNIFEPFVYTALGHLHNEHFVGEENLRYSGSVLCFSQTEARNSPLKKVVIVDIEDGKVSVKTHPITPLRPARIIEGTMAELLSMPHSDDYVYINIHESDETGLFDPSELSEHFPHMVKRIFSFGSDEREPSSFLTEKQDFEDIFQEFFSTVTGNEIDEEMLSCAKEIFEQTDCEEDSYDC